MNNNLIKGEDLKASNILHLSLLAGLLMMTSITYYMLQSGSSMIYDYKSKFFIISAVLIFIGIFIGNKVYSTNVNAAEKKDFGSYGDAFRYFKIANIMKWAFIEAATLISIVLAFIDRNPMIYLPVVIGIFYLFSSKMKPEHFKNYWK